MTQENKAIVFHLTNRGTYSEINNLILAYGYSQEKNLEFFVDDRCWSGASSRGLSDYFEVQNFKFWNKGLKLRSVLNNNANGASKFKNFTNLILFSIYKKLFMKVNKILYPTYLFTPEYFHLMRLKGTAPYSIGGKFIEPYEFHDTNIKRLVKYNKETNALISERISSVKNSLGDDYIGVHIRRGDKINDQSSELSLQLYCNEINKYPKKNLFIATDDVSVIDFIRVNVGPRKIFTFADSNRKGWVEAKFRKTSGSKKYDEMIELFTDVEALILSDIFIGTFSSCVGQYINVRRQGRETVSLDSNFYFN